MFDPAEQDRVLKEFLAEHVRPYDPETDDYDRQPSSADVVSSGRSGFYSFHYYLTKVPPETITGLIRHYTMPGDVVLDPFSGSGMTGVAIQMVNQKDCAAQRYCILNDLSPAACHIAANYISPVQAEKLSDEFTRIAPILEQQEELLYSTDHFQPAYGLYSSGRNEVLAALGDPAYKGLFNDILRITSLRGRWQLVGRSQVEEYMGYSVPPVDDAESKDVWLRIPARLIYVVWSDVYKCEGFRTVEMPTGKDHPKTGRPMMRKLRTRRGCGREIIARGTDDKQKDDGNNAFIRCPHCNERWMKGRIPRLRVDPVEECFEYLGLVSSRAGTSFKLIRERRPIAKKQKDFISKLSQQEIPLAFPNPPLNKSNPRYRRDSLAGKKIEEYRDFFTKRNLWALASIWNVIPQAQESVQGALQFCFTSQTMRCSRLRRMKGDKPGEQLSGTLHIASETVETNVFSVFRKAVHDYCASVGTVGLSDMVKPIVRLGSATDLSEIPDNSIDYIFTDPPFGSNIYYSGVTFMWEAWLGCFTNEPLEAIMHREVDGGYKRLEHYADLMAKAFTEMFRVLKPARYATVEFNNSDGAVFQVIRDGLLSAGFQIDNMLLFDKVARTFAQIRSTTGVSEVVDKDVLFNLHKPAVVRAEVQAEDHDLEHQVADAVRQHLQSLPERIRSDPAKYNDEHRTTATINSMLMNTLIPRGVSVERLNLSFIERICARYFRKVGQRWYLRGEAVGGNGGDLVQEEVAIKDELTAIAWLRQKLESRPALIGELKPLWMKATGLLPASVSQSLVLGDLLISNFWRDEGTNRWREPTAEERDRMNDDKTIRVLHDAERYVAGNLRRQTTDAERCEWIDALFQMCRALEENDANVLPSIRDLAPDEGYRLIGRLFQGVLKDRVSPDVYSRAAKQAGVASQRNVQDVEDKAEKAKANRRKKEGATLFDL